MTEEDKERGIIAVSIQDAGEAVRNLAVVMAGSPPRLDDVRIKTAAMLLRKAAWRAQHGTIEGWADWEASTTPSGGTGAMWDAPKEKPTIDSEPVPTPLPMMLSGYVVGAPDKSEEHEEHEEPSCALCGDLGWIKAGGQPNARTRQAWRSHTHIQWIVCPVCRNQYDCEEP